MGSGFDLESACAVAGSDEYRVPLRMPGRSGPAKANGPESTADENVPVPGPPLVRTGYGFSTAYHWAPMVLSRR